MSTFQRRLMAAIFCAGWLLMLTVRADAPQQIPITARLQYEGLMRDAEILRLRVCSEAGIKHTECRVDWQAGTVGKIERQALTGDVSPAKKQAP